MSKNQLHQSRESIIFAISSWTKWIFNLNIGRFCVVDIWPHCMSELSVNNNAQREKDTSQNQKFAFKSISYKKHNFKRYQESCQWKIILCFNLKTFIIVLAQQLIKISTCCRKTNASIFAIKSFVCCLLCCVFGGKFNHLIKAIMGEVLTEHF